MKNVILLFVAVLIFTACGHHNNDGAQKEISQEQIQKINKDLKKIPLATHDSTEAEKFYAEMFYKKDLKFGSWKDSTEETSEGSGINPYLQPTKIQHGTTKNFKFMITSWWEQWDEADGIKNWENKGWKIEFKVRNIAEGRTLAEDKSMYEWQQLPLYKPNLDGLLKSYLSEPMYPKMSFHKTKE